VWKIEFVIVNFRHSSYALSLATHQPIPMSKPKNLFSYRPYWAHRFGIAPFLPMTRAEMEHLGWDSCDIIIVTGDGYIDHPSFGMALIGRLLESQGFRVGIIAQPNWQTIDAFQVLGKPNLFWGVTAGNMDSMVNRYTSDRKIRSNDAYTPNGQPNQRPDRATLVYAQRCRQAHKDIHIIIGGIEASLRRIAHYDYWSDTVRRSILVDAKADMLLFGNAERAIIELAHRLAAGENIAEIQNIRGTAFIRDTLPENWLEIDSTQIDTPTAQKVTFPNPYQENNQSEQMIAAPVTRPTRQNRELSFIRLPSFEQVKADPVLYAHTSRLLHLESNPHNARPLVQRQGQRDVWLNPPPLPLTTEEMDKVYELPYARSAHPCYQNAPIPAYEMIRFSVTIMRGCFGGCTFCSITEHEGRIIQNRSEDSIIRELETLRTVPEFTGVVSDLGGPTANMYRLHCKKPEIEALCRRLSCVYPSICKNLNTDHSDLIHLYQRARTVPGIKKIVISSGLRYDLAVQSPEYVKELVTHHVGGYLKIAPEHTEAAPLSKMMKPGVETYYKFKAMFDKYSQLAGKEQYLIPYFIAAHPGTSDEDMLNLALWLKQNDFRPDQVQAFLPSPMALATAMYYSGKNPLHPVRYDSETVNSPKGLIQRRLHKAFLRYHDSANWDILRDALRRMGREDLIGNGKKHLVPNFQPSKLVGKPNFAKTQPTAQKSTVQPKFSKKSAAQWTTGSPSGRGKRR
jgi:uncharacterized radical SAM protein YgiQ